MVGKYRFLVIVVALGVLTFILFNKCNSSLENIVSKSNYSYYNPCKLRDSIKIEGELIEVLTTFILKDLDSFDVLESGYVVLKRKDIDSLRMVNIQSIYLLNDGLYFVMSKSLSTMNKSYGILFSTKKIGELKRYPIKKVNFLKFFKKGSGSFYFIEAKI